MHLGLPTPSTVCVRKVCQWSDWYDGGHPEPGMSGGDFETFENLRQRGYQVCLAPVDIECQAQLFPGMPLEKLGQKGEAQCGVSITRSTYGPLGFSILNCTRELMSQALYPGLGELYSHYWRMSFGR